jgi:peptidoglycan/xylan/chitin deacetylase (PgdA/CDA1 family)
MLAAPAKDDHQSRHGGVVVYVRCLAVVVACCTGFAIGDDALAAACPARTDALGTARVLTVDPAMQSRVGAMQYRDTLPLADKEVVLTFDDGPLPAYTAQILQALEAECVKATFFMVGRMARAYPEWVRRVHNAGHTVATHSDRHPRRFDLLGHDQGFEEIERGIAAATTALGDRRALAPFFRFPGLRRSAAMEDYLERRGIMVWSADIPGDDWKPITADMVTARVLDRLERKGRGIVLLHDIQARTALALPGLLRELKARGYRIVHVVPSTPGRPVMVAEPKVRAPQTGRRGIWPVAMVTAGAPKPAELSVPSALSFGFPNPFAAELDIGPVDDAAMPMRIAQSALPLPGSGSGKTTKTIWRRPDVTLVADGSEGISVPSGQSLDLSQPLAAHRAPQLEDGATPRPGGSNPARRRVSAKRRTVRAQAAPGEVRLRGRIDEDTGEQNWSRQLNWFH